MSDKMIFQIPSYIVRDKSLSSGGRQFVIETQENLPPEHLQKLISLENKLGWFTFSVNIIEAVDLMSLPKIDRSKYMDAKTPSQRLRSVLFLLWQQQKENGMEFEKFYENKMETLISQEKGKLE